MPQIRPLTDAETRRLAAELRDRCWPGGARPLPLACGCLHGRCDVCN